MMKESPTPDSILRQILDLEKYVSGMDIHRMNHQKIYNQINLILSDANISTLNSFNDIEISNEIISIALKTSQALPYELLLLISIQLKKLNAAGEFFTKKINRSVIRQKQKQNWEKRKPWFLLLIAIMICLVIFVLGNQP